MSPSRAAPRRGAGPAAGTQALAQGASPRPRRGRVAPARYRILGRPVTLESDSPELLRVFDQDYAWFREEGDRAGRPIHFTVPLRAGEGSELRMWDGPADGRPPRCRHPLAGQADAVMAVYRLRLRELFNALDERSFCQARRPR